MEWFASCFVPSMRARLRLPPRIALGLWCLSLIVPGHALPLARPASSPLPPPLEAKADRPATAFVTGEAPERMLDAPVELGAADPATSDMLIDPADRQRLTIPKDAVPEPFDDGIAGIDELAFDTPGRKAWFADDEDLMKRMRNIRDRFNTLLVADLGEKINQVGRELLESLGIEDTTTARLIAARADTRAEMPGWTVQAAGNGRGPGEAAWVSESGRNLMAKFLFLLWDTATHPVLVALVLLVVAVRLMLALSRLSTRRRERRARRSSRSTHHRHSRTAAAIPQWTRRHRVR